MICRFTYGLDNPLKIYRGLYTVLLYIHLITWDEGVRLTEEEGRGSCILNLGATATVLIVLFCANLNTVHYHIMAWLAVLR